MGSDEGTALLPHERQLKSGDLLQRGDYRQGRSSERLAARAHYAAESRLLNHTVEDRVQFDFAAALSAN